MVWFLVSIQVVNWAIEHKQEQHLEKAISDFGVSFHSFEVHVDDVKSSMKWSSLDARFYKQSFWPFLKFTSIQWMCRPFCFFPCILRLLVQGEPLKH